MKKEYSPPELQIVVFRIENIVTTSYTIDVGDDGVFFDDIW